VAYAIDKLFASVIKGYDTLVFFVVSTTAATEFSGDAGNG